MRQITVGEFTITEKGGDVSVEGPASYVRERLHEMLEKIGNGESMVFNFSEGDLLTAIGVAVQTDYAAWKGMDDFYRQHKLTKGA
jgi:hypothetical protein